MFFFFIAGVQPRERTVDKTPRRCPRCGHNSAVLKRTDRFFSLFFIPLFPVGEGREYLVCGNCGYSERESFLPEDLPFADRGTACPSCGREEERGYNFCPHCGRRLG